MTLPSTNEPEWTSWSDLGPEDSQALDALIDAGFDLESVPETHRFRARNIARLLARLDQGQQVVSEDLVDRTLGLIAGQVLQHHGKPDDPPTLCPADEDALDAWVMYASRPGAVPGSLRERVQRHEALAQLVRATPVAGEEKSADWLVDATLNRIESAEISEREWMLIRPARSLRLADVLSVAAVVLLAVSIAFPIFGSLRDGSRRAICDANLGRVASALGLYAGANDDSLPMATAGFGGKPWIRVGEDPAQSNSANLYVLIRKDYTKLADLACPGNPNAPTIETRRGAQDWQRLEEVSYSYQVPGGVRAKRFWEGDFAVPAVADRSPVILHIVRKEPIRPEENSPNHGASGQHLIWTDGSVSWQDSPVLESGDNIWLPRAIEHAVAQARRYYGMEGNEVPDSVNDSLLGP